jgi:hypothetical protein
MGDVHRCDRLPKDLQTSAIPSGKQVHGLGSCFVPGEPLRTDLLGNCAQKGIAARSDMKNIIKGSKTLPITQVDKVRWHGWPHRRPYRNPAKTHVLTDSCSEPYFHHLQSSKI